MSGVSPGLCDRCAYQKLVHSGRGSTFSMCLRNRSEPDRFPKYPSLPVRDCAGHEPRGHSTVSGSTSTR